MSTLSNQERVFAALIEEAKALRAENIVAVTNVRRMALAATYIAGFGLPLIGGVLQLNKSGETSGASPGLLELVRRNPEPIVCIGLSVSLTCLAALSIYLGTFRQIFNYARYFRDILIPNINALAGSPEQKVFGWEIWLRTQRSGRRLSVGDADLAAEPTLIALYTFAYCAIFVLASYYLNSPGFIICVCLSCGIVTYAVRLLVGFLLILRDAAGRPKLRRARKRR